MGTACLLPSEQANCGSGESAQPNGRVACPAPHRPWQSLGEWCLRARLQHATPWDVGWGEVRILFVPGTVTGQQGWGDGLGVEPEKPHSSRSCCWRTVHTSDVVCVPTSMGGVPDGAGASCLSVATSGAKGANVTAFVCACACTHTHTLLYLLECALASGCSSLPPSHEASENPSSVSEVNLFAVSTSAYESSEDAIDKCRVWCQKSCLEPKTLHTSALKA